MGKILENVQAATGGTTGGAAGQPAAASRKLQVDELVVAGAKIHLSTSVLGGAAATVPLPDFQLTALGTGPEGITAAELTKRLLKEIVDGTLKTLSTAGLDLGKGALDSVTQGATGEAEKAVRGVSDLFRKKKN
jgi:hypothetical protein